MSCSTPDRDAVRRAWEREYAQVHAYTTSYRDDLDRGIQFLQAFLEATGEAVAGPVLECACGRGRNVMPLVAAGHRVVGLDHALAALAQLRRRIVDAGATGAAIALRHDLRQPLPVRDGACGLVVDITAIDNLVSVEHQRQYGREVARVLRPGGLALVVTFDRDDGYYAPFLGGAPAVHGGDPVASAGRPPPAGAGVVEDPHTGIRNQLFRGPQLDAIFCPPLHRVAANRFDFIDEAASERWTRRFLLRLYRRPVADHG